MDSDELEQRQRALSDEVRGAFMRHVDAGISYREVAVLLGTVLGTSYSMIQQLLGAEHLRKVQQAALERADEHAATQRLH
jgi:DNA-directed RNA polymerase specialized sigma24 family protein